MASHADPLEIPVPASGWRKRVVPILIVLATVAAMGIDVATSIGEQADERDETIAHAEGRLRAAAGELAASVGARLAGMDGDLIAIMNSIDLVDGTWNVAPAAQLLARLRLGEGRGAEYLIVDAGGTIVLSSEGRRVSGPVMADRDYFRHHRSDPSPLPHLLWVSDSNVTGRPLVGVSRRIEDAYGTFGGIVAAGIDPATLTGLLGAATRDRRSVGALFLADGTLLLRRPDPDGVSGRIRIDSRLFRDEVPQAESGWYLTTDNRMPEPYFIAWRKVGDWPLVVAIMIPRTEVLAAWSAGVRDEAIASLGILAALTVVLLIAMRSHYASRRAADEGARLARDMRAARDRERAVLDAMIPNIAVIDPGGIILAVNAAWRRFALANSDGKHDIGPGDDYLDVTDRAAAGGDELAARAAAGLRALLGGETRRFTMEYPCDAPGVPRWFLLDATPLGNGDGVRGAVVVHVDMTDIRRTHRTLEERESLLRGLAANVPGVLFQHVLGADGQRRLVYVSERSREILGVDPRRAIAENSLIGHAASPEDFARIAERYDALLREGGRWETEFEIRLPDGTRRWLRGAAAVDRTVDGEGRANGILLDATAEHEAAEALKRLAREDPLTGLHSRRSLIEYATAALMDPQPGGMLALHFFDLDEFRLVNDALGMERGDAVLKAVGSRLRELAGDDSIVARVSGDGFAVLQTPVADRAAAETLARTILADLSTRAVSIPGFETRLMVSAGTVFADTDEAADGNVLLDRASAALHAAKAAGRGSWRVYERAMDQDTHSQLELRNALAGALHRDELALHYQPKVSLADGRVTGFEALLRWHHPTFGDQPPGRFVPVAERSGLIVPIGAWALDTACRQIVAWRKAGLDQVTVAVNVSAAQFHGTDLAATVEEVLARTGLDPHALELELTEGILFRATDAVFETLARIRALGVRLSIDDFGTGYSSLAYLKTLPVDIVKIDRAFVTHIDSDPADQAVAGAAITLGHGLGMRMVAEGIETDAQLGMLRSMGCDEGQGFLLSRPLVADAVPGFIATGAAELRHRMESVDGPTGPYSDPRPPFGPPPGEP
ncbi:MAG: EAL domain-containing protein [Alphaproteobacteria bacterium]